MVKILKELAEMAVSLSLCLIITLPAWADVDENISQLQRRWATTNYQLEGKTQLTEFELLVEKAEKLTREYPDVPSVWIWSGIIKSTYAGAKGGLGALKLAKSSKADLEKALALDPGAMAGSAYTSLGALYESVPGWPIGFGNDKKAREMLLKGLEINPDGIDSNYFYGTYLMDNKDYITAETVMLKALDAPARPGRILADEGRKKEINQVLVLIRSKINH